ncbi:hypothetical protein B0A94_26740 [Pseudomonas syringae]|nr:hypothetical protein B1F67_22460 [Pseudomonas syringae]RXU13692.1 hypothetical protein BXU05_11915 [Pseudomonas syringae]RXU29532.1 hypothetical protein B0A94_26740 [Pseudomonas syringae]RXU29586.1 hypothetical protein B0A90_27030 [Pseudomonas syringae]
MRNIPQTCLASTILFHGCEFCLLCIFTHDASKGCIQPSGVTPLRVGMQFVTLCVTRRFFIVRWIEVRLRSPFRPSATHFEGPK